MAVVIGACHEDRRDRSYVYQCELPIGYRRRSRQADAAAFVESVDTAESMLQGSIGPILHLAQQLVPSVILPTG